MAKTSTEGSCLGLGWIDGKVNIINKNLILPHMGWNEINVKSNGLDYYLIYKVEDFIFFIAIIHS